MKLLITGIVTFMAIVIWVLICFGFWSLVFNRKNKEDNHEEICD
jgi:hypothetical protein